MKKTKEQLIKDNAVLEKEATQLKEEDLKIRTTLSELLGSFKEEKDPIIGMWSGRPKVVDVCDWLEIAYLIGELKADANYSCVLDKASDLERTVSFLKRENETLKNPKSEKEELEDDD